MPFAIRPEWPDMRAMSQISRLSRARPRSRPLHAPMRCAHAEALCEARAQRLTPIRRQVLEALLASHKPLGAYEIIELHRRGRRAPGADHDLSRARFPDGERPRSPHRKPQRLHRLHPQSRHRRFRRVPDLRALRRGRRGVVESGRRDTEDGGEGRGLFTQGAGDRNYRRLRALPRQRDASGVHGEHAAKSRRCPPRVRSTWPAAATRRFAVPELGLQSGRGETCAA